MTESSTVEGLVAGLGGQSLRADLSTLTEVSERPPFGPFVPKGR